MNKKVYIFGIIIVKYSNQNAIDVLQLMVFDTSDNVQKTQNQDQFWDQPINKKTDPSPKMKNQTINEQEAQTFVKYVDSFYKLKSLSDNCMSICRELTETQTYHLMLSYGLKNPPQSMIGYFMRLMGNIMLRYVKSVKNKLILHHNHEVIGIRLLTDGWIQLRLQKSNSTDEQNNKISGPKVIQAYHTIKAKSVLFCVGREQNQSTHLSGHQLTTTSELVQQDETLISVYKHILQHSKTKSTIKVVILGGGQSAFSCADLLLSGPITYRYDEGQNQQTSFTQKRFNCEYAYHQVKQKEKYGHKYSVSEDPDQYGSLKPQNYKWQSTNVVIPTFQKYDIQILTDEEVSIYSNNEFDTIKQQVQFDIDNVSPPQNYVKGLKGKAKDLYLNIQNLKEERVSVINTKNFAEITKEALVVIDSRNLKARTIPIRDREGNLVETIMHNGLYQLDQFGRIKTQRGSIRNMYGFGSCAIPLDLYNGMDKNEKLSKQEVNLNFHETSHIQQLRKGLRLIEESVKHGEHSMATQTWFDQNEFPLTGQTSEFLTRGEFDSDSKSQNSDLVEQETFALNSIDLMLRSEKQMIRFDKVEKLYKMKK